MPLTIVQRSKIIDIQNKINEAIQEIANFEDVEIKLSSPTYDNLDCKFSLDISFREDDDKEFYEPLSRKIGFTQNIVGLEFKHPRFGNFKISQIKTRNRKYPVIAYNTDGKGYKFTVDQIKRYLGGDKLINRNANLDKLIGDDNCEI